ncbi:hypothetical protein VTN00DRAFT_8536 [Thermoascus crustaceus]|uniref:uncharacterized protein n=1 Tax=Thermoascus crustaceus TaxID=5088 RepID=UPI0037445794
MSVYGRTTYCGFVLHGLGLDTWDSWGPWGQLHILQPRRSTALSSQYHRHFARAATPFSPVILRLSIDAPLVTLCALNNLQYRGSGQPGPSIKRVGPLFIVVAQRKTTLRLHQAHDPAYQVAAATHLEICSSTPHQGVPAPRRASYHIGVPQKLLAMTGVRLPKSLVGDIARYAGASSTSGLSDIFHWLVAVVKTFI